MLSMVVKNMFDTLLSNDTKKYEIYKYINNYKVTKSQSQPFRF